MSSENYKLLGRDARDSYWQAWKKAFSRDYPDDVRDWILTEKNRTYVIVLNGAVVAGYSLYEVPTIINGRLCRGALCNNVFVDPDWAGQFYFVKLGRYALSCAEQEGIEVAYGIPNEQALSGHRRVGWTCFADIPFIENMNLSVEHFPEGDLKDADIGTLAEIERFSKEMATHRGFSVIKTDQWLRWRYLENPRYNYRIAIVREEGKLTGYIVFKDYAPIETTHILDVEAVSDRALRSLLHYLQGNASYKRVNLWASTPYQHVFMEEGFKRTSQSNHFIGIFPYKKEHVHLNAPINIGLGDNDAY